MQVTCLVHFNLLDITLTIQFFPDDTSSLTKHSKNTSVQRSINVDWKPWN